MSIIVYKMYWIKTPWFVKAVYPGLIWNMSGQKELYLTFDDGPVPVVTEQVLDLLIQYNAASTFFCIGENIKKHPGIFNRIIKEGHTIGNHTYNHLNGWKSNNEEYIKNIAACNTLANSRLFRPPYGRIGIKQIQYLRNYYKIIMWDVLSGDFDIAQTPASCADNVIQHAEAGSIVVFHDSVKAKQNVLGALPLVLKYFSEKGFIFKPLPKTIDEFN